MLRDTHLKMSVKKGISKISENMWIIILVRVYFSKVTDQQGATLCVCVCVCPFYIHFYSLFYLFYVLFYRRRTWALSFECKTNRADFTDWMSLLLANSMKKISHNPDALIANTECFSSVWNS